MELAPFFHQYIDFKCSKSPVSREIDKFVYYQCEDGGAELFFIESDDVVFPEWNYHLFPEDPHYYKECNWKPILFDKFEEINLYDEQVFLYLLFTINSATSINKINKNNMDRDFVKNYSFLQLSRINDFLSISKRDKNKLRNLFFHSFLYSHPVNYETLYAFSIRDGDVFHIKSGVLVKDYFNSYYDFFVEHYEEYKNKIPITIDEVISCKKLTSLLLDNIEGTSNGLKFPRENIDDGLIETINNFDVLIDVYNKDKESFYEKLKNSLLGSNRGNIFIEFLLQNYVCYILYFDMDEINNFVECFSKERELCGFLINKIFYNPIFIKKILISQKKNLSSYDRVTCFLDEETISMYSHT
ncbi:hypothetical protein [Xenorhabdus bovienii]|uniref:hypothetical protein n=1 Tax=Xenorhabdus bovienii TaxID=40576 RepID=UPI0023B314D8|nr:hypothetical protein [Xenorhabdus bovienii]MDE9483032.1 hypothetical protein [Xenorhabdus bovienii]